MSEHVARHEDGDRRPDVDARAWAGWVAHVCAAVGVEPARVDIAAIHSLTGAVAAGFTRPMAPVAAHIWGLAQVAHPDADPDALRDAILAAMPARGLPA